MNHENIRDLLLEQIGAFGASAFVILGSVVIAIVAFLVFRWGIMKLETSVLGYMHGASGTARFRSLGATSQRAWSAVDRKLSRRQIMRMENM